MLYFLRECHQLVKEAGCLVTQEGSLALSLAHLPREGSQAHLPTGETSREGAGEEGDVEA